MNTYKTAQIAARMGVHPNTVRLYEKLELIPKPQRRANGYRVFTDFHLEQFKLARLAFAIEVLQKGLRKKIVEMVKVSATGDFDGAIALTREYLCQLRAERQNAGEAAELVRQILSGGNPGGTQRLKRQAVSRALGISMDTLRNWEMNGLLSIKRRENGYRVYTDADMRQLKIIRALRGANYSLEAIGQMLRQLSHNPDADIIAALNTPGEDAPIISVCDQLIASLTAAEGNALQIIALLQAMKTKF